MANKVNKGLLWILALVVVGILVIGGMKLIGTQQTAIGQPTTEEGETLASIPQATVEFKFSAMAGTDAQDSENDADLVIFEVDQDKIDTLLEKNYMDCNSAFENPAKIPDGKTLMQVPETALCDMNEKEFWGGITAGAVETELGTHIGTAVGYDLDVVDSSAGATESIVLEPGKTYLVIGTEVADTDEEDIVPFGIVFQLPDKTTEAILESVVNANAKLRYEFKYKSDAVAHGEYEVSGKCSDSEGKESPMTSTLDGVVDSSHTTAVTNLDVDCEIDFKLSDDGYVFVGEEKVAGSNSDKPYLQVSTYGTAYYNATTINWEILGTTNALASYPIKYGTSALSATGNQIFWESAEVCKRVITDDSTSNADVNNGAKLYDLSCMKTLDEEDEEFTIDVHIENIASADYDATVTANNAILESNSYSSEEAILDISMVSVEATTDVIGAQLS